MINANPTVSKHSSSIAVSGRETKKRKISTKKPITKEELAAIKQSVLEARFGIRFWGKGLRQFTKAESKFAEIVHGAETLLRALRFDVGRES